MRRREFHVPAEVMVEFTGTLTENELANQVTGLTEDDEIIIEVAYDREDRPIIFELTELIEDYREEQEEDD